MQYTSMLNISFAFRIHYIYKLHTLSHSSGTDEYLIRHHLSDKEFQALKDILQKDIIDSLQQSGLGLGNAQTTLEEVQRLLHSLGQHEVASNLRQHLDLGKHLKLANGHRNPYNKFS